MMFTFILLVVMVIWSNCGRFTGGGKGDVREGCGERGRQGGVGGRGTSAREGWGEGGR